VTFRRAPRGRSCVRRNPHRGHYDRATIDDVLDANLVAHVAFVDAGQPFCVPFLYVRTGDSLLIHGSSASRAMRILGDGVPACFTVTALDGLVLARSVFEHSANYRSVTVLGAFQQVGAPPEQVVAFRALTDALVPGRWDEVRPPSDQELKASTILVLAIDEASAKIRTGPPTDDDSDDAALPIWAGELPLVSHWGSPIPSPGLQADIAVPQSVNQLRDGPVVRPHSGPEAFSAADTSSSALVITRRTPTDIATKPPKSSGSQPGPQDVSR
jgi:uncharacterized protein